MQHTITFEAHELPAVLTALLRMAGNDADKIIAAARAGLGSNAGAAAAPAPQPPAPPAAVAPATVADEGGAPLLFAAPQVQPSVGVVVPATTDAPKRRGRKPKTVDPTLSAVPAADLPPPVVLATSPTTTAAGSPVADAMPVAAVAPPNPVVAPLQQPAAATGAPVTDDALRSAYIAAEARGCTADKIIPLLGKYGVAKLRDVPAPRRGELLADLTALTP